MERACVASLYILCKPARVFKAPAFIRFTITIITKAKLIIRELLEKEMVQDNKLVYATVYFPICTYYKFWSHITITWNPDPKEFTTNMSSNFPCID